MTQACSLLLILSALIASTYSFFVSTPQKSQCSILSMSGGRSKAEQGKTSRTMFKELRGKLNKAAEIPGFFDVGEKSELDLYCKASKDGIQIGDCPFTQFVQMVLQKKGINYSLHPLLPTNKPSWLVEKHEGKMPAIVHKGVSMTDSLAIAEYIEKTFPHSSLTRQGAYSYQEVLEKTQGFFPAMSAFIKNKDSGKDSSLQAEVDKQLDMMDEILRSTPGQYICGIEMTLADLYLTPQLFHGVVAMEHFKDHTFFHIDGEPTRPALENYLSRMLELPEFNSKKAYYGADQVVNGWKVARGEA